MHQKNLHLIKHFWLNKVKLLHKISMQILLGNHHNIPINYTLIKIQQPINNYQHFKRQYVCNES